MSNFSMTEAVRTAFSDRKELNLSELYEIIFSDPNVSAEDAGRVKHQVRSCVHTMHKSNRIVRTAAGKYRISDSVTS